MTDPVQTIDIPLGLFADIAPTLGDLELTAHVRRLSVQNKPMALGTQPPADPIGTFAIVVGNRLPQPAKQSHAYLVSLESLAGFLPATSDGGTLTTSGLNMTKSLRLAVLLHWTFFTKQDESAAFVDRLEQLNGRTVTKVNGQTVYGPDAANTDLRLTAPGASPPISTALDSGYVPLDHDLRTTETTVSWYRGPLSPIDRTPAGITLPISSPDQALVFDPTTGMFDASLAAAWTIGRLVALQDQSYATLAVRMEEGADQTVVDSVERTDHRRGLRRPDRPAADNRAAAGDTARAADSAAGDAARGTDRAPIHQDAAARHDAADQERRCAMTLTMFSREQRRQAIEATFATRHRSRTRSARSGPGRHRGLAWPAPHPGRGCRSGTSSRTRACCRRSRSGSSGSTRSGCGRCSTARSASAATSPPRQAARAPTSTAS